MGERSADPIFELSDNGRSVAFFHCLLCISNGLLRHCPQRDCDYCRGCEEAFGVGSTTSAAPSHLLRRDRGLSRILLEGIRVACTTSLASSCLLYAGCCLQAVLSTHTMTMLNNLEAGLRRPKTIGEGISNTAVLSKRLAVDSRELLIGFFLPNRRPHVEEPICLMLVIGPSSRGDVRMGPTLRLHLPRLRLNFQLMLGFTPPRTLNFVAISVETNKLIHQIWGSSVCIPGLMLRRRCG